MKLNESLIGEIRKCADAIRSGGSCIYPGETGWSIACGFQSEDLIKICAGEFPCLLLESAGQLQKYVKAIPEMLWDIESFSTTPLSFRLTGVVNLPQVLCRENEADFRIPKDEFTLALLHKTGPLISAQAGNLHPWTGAGNPLNQMPYVVNLRLSPRHNIANLKVMHLLPSGTIKFIKK